MQCQFPATVSKITTRVDGSLSITFETREMNHEHAAALFGLRKHEGWVLFADKEFQEADIADLPPLPSAGNKKSHSAQLRSLLYRLWEALKKPGGSEEFYVFRMEKFKESVRNELDRLR